MKSGSSVSQPVEDPIVMIIVSLVSSLGKSQGRGMDMDGLGLLSAGPGGRPAHPPHTCCPPCLPGDVLQRSPGTTTLSHSSVFTAPRSRLPLRSH